MLKRLLALTLAAMPIVAQAQTIEPTARMAAYDEALIGVMKQRVGLAARTDRFEAIVREYYDMPAIAQIVVGLKWATSSPADREAAIAALTRHSAVTLARNFATFDGERFTVDPAAISRGTSKIVRVRIVSKDSNDTLLYQFREGRGGWRIIDVISGGVSQLAVQRADVAAAVEAGGAAGLAKQLGKLDAAVR